MAYTCDFDQLKDDILAWTEEDSIEFDASLPRIIALAETKVLRDLDLQCFMDFSTDANLVVATSEQTVPASMLAPKELWITDGCLDRKQVEKRTPAYILAYFDRTRDAAPLYWGIRNETQFMVAPKPDSNYAFTFHGIVRPEGLSDANPITWLGTNVGDLLLKACLIEAEQYLLGAAPLAVWKMDYGSGLVTAKTEFSNLSRVDFLGSVMQRGHG